MIDALVGLGIVFGPIVVIWLAWHHLQRQWRADDYHPRHRTPDDWVLNHRKAIATAVATSLSLLWLTSLTLNIFTKSPEYMSTKLPQFESLLQARMKPMSAAFFSPSPVKRNETFEAVLRVSPPSMSPEDVAQELKLEAARQGVFAADSVQFEPIYVASLTSDRESRIVLQGGTPSRAVVPGDTLTWRWYVSTSDGPLKLTATLNTPLTVAGIATGAEVHTPFTKTVTVTVTPAQQFQDILTFVKDYWALLGAVVAGLGWLLARWKRRRRPPPPKPYEAPA